MPLQIVDPASTVCRVAPAPNREAAKQAMKDLGVSLLLNQRVTSISHTPSPATDTASPSEPFLAGQSPLPIVPPYCIALTATNLPADAPPAGDRTAPFDNYSDSTIDADLVLWTVGSAPVLPQISPEPVEEDRRRGAEEEEAEGRLKWGARGQAVVEESLRVAGQTAVFAIGDSAFVKDYRGGGTLPATAQVGHPVTALSTQRVSGRVCKCGCHYWWRLDHLLTPHLSP